MKKYFTLLTLCFQLFMLVSCNDKNVTEETPQPFLSFSFKMEHNQQSLLKDVDGTIKGYKIEIKSPFICSPKLIATFNSQGQKVLVNGKEQKSGVTENDFSTSVTYTIVTPNGNKQDYIVQVSYSGLPVVIIETPNKAEIPSKHEDWLSGSKFTIISPDKDENISGEMGIRGRGNSTWKYPKKPYALKLDKKAEILGMPKHKRWVLLANWMDRTLLRNATAFQIAQCTGLDWTPRGRFVEVVLNDEHIGNYYLCEHIKIDENRVNIQEMESTDVSSEAITGGYLIELDIYYDEVNKFRSTIKDLPYMIKEPDEDALVQEQLDYLKNYVDEMEHALYDDALFATEKYLEYMDIDSHIDWWFVHELATNAEPKHPKSCYMHKDRNGKLKAGPVWDFDWGTFKNRIYHVNEKALYFERLFQSPTFTQRVKERWDLFKNKFKAIPSYIDKEQKNIRASEAMNHSYWPIDKDTNGDEDLSFDAAVKKMRDNYNKKYDWLDKMINDL